MIAVRIHADLRQAPMLGVIAVLVFSAYLSAHVAVAQNEAQSETAQAQNAGTADLITGFESLKEHYRMLQPRANVTGKPTADATLELYGLVVDETRSRLGRQFYELFYSQWEPPKGSGSHTLEVEERPGLGRGSVVFVRIDDELVYGSRLQPRYSEIEQAAKAAIYYATRHLQKQAAPQNTNN